MLKNDQKQGWKGADPPLSHRGINPTQATAGKWLSNQSLQVSFLESPYFLSTQFIPGPHYYNYKKGISKLHCCKVKHTVSCPIHNAQGKDLHSLLQLPFIYIKFIISLLSLFPLSIKNLFEPLLFWHFIGNVLSHTDLWIIRVQKTECEVTYV